MFTSFGSLSYVIWDYAFTRKFMLYISLIQANQSSMAKKRKNSEIFQFLVGV